MRSLRGGGADARRSRRRVPRSRRFIGINVRDDLASAREFNARFSIRYPSIVDQDGSIAARLRPWLPVQAIPGTLVIDRDGRVAASVIGKVRRSVLTATLEDLLAERLVGGLTSVAAVPGLT